MTKEKVAPLPQLQLIANQVNTIHASVNQSWKSMGALVLSTATTQLLEPTIVQTTEYVATHIISQSSFWVPSEIQILSAALNQHIFPYLAATLEQLPEFTTEALIYLFKSTVVANMLITLGLAYFIAHWLLPMILPIPKIVDTSEKELKKKLENANTLAVATIVGYTLLFIVSASLFINSINKAIDELDWLRLSLLFILKMVENYLKSVPNAEAIVAATNKLTYQLEELQRGGLTEEKIAEALIMTKPNQEGIFLKALYDLRDALQIGKNSMNPKALHRIEGLLDLNLDAVEKGVWQKCNVPVLLKTYEALEARVIAWNREKKYLTGDELADTVRAEIVKRVPIVACVENNLKNPQIITKYNKVASNASITATAIVSFIFVCIKQIHNLYMTYQLSKTSARAFEQLSDIVEGFTNCSWVMPENDFTFTFTLVLEREFVKLKDIQIPTSVFLSILQRILAENNSYIKILRNSFNTLKISMESVFLDEALLILNQQLSDSIRKHHQQKIIKNNIFKQLNSLHPSLSFCDISEWNENDEVFEFRAHFSIYQLSQEHVDAIEKAMNDIFAKNLKIDMGKYFVVIELEKMVAIEPEIIKAQSKTLEQLFLKQSAKNLKEKETSKESKANVPSAENASSRSAPMVSKTDNSSQKNIVPLQSDKSEVGLAIKSEVSAIFKSLVFVPQNNNVFRENISIIPIENTKKRPNEKLFLYFDEKELGDYQMVLQFQKAVMASPWIIPEDGKQGVVRCGAEIFKIKKEGDPRLWGYIAYSTSVSGEQIKLIRICVVQRKHEEYDKAYKQVKHALSEWKKANPNYYLAPKPNLLKRLNYG